MEEWLDKVYQKSRLLQRLSAWSKRSSWVGYRHISIYNTLAFIIREINSDDVLFRSYAISYAFFVSLFPTILVFFTVLPYLPAFEYIDETIEIYIYDLIPGENADIAYEFIQEIMLRERTGLLSLSFILAIYFSSNGMVAMMQAFEKNYPGTYKDRTTIRKRLIAIALTLSFGLLFISSAIIITGGTVAINVAREIYDLGGVYNFFAWLVQWTSIGLLFYSAIAITYRYGAATIERFRWITPGAMLAVVLCLVSSLGFAIYIDNFNSYNKLYGSIGTIIVFMVWLQLNILWILVGYELNASIILSDPEVHDRLADPPLPVPGA